LSQDKPVTVQGWTALNLLFDQIDGNELLFFIHAGQRPLGLLVLVGEVIDHLTAQRRRYHFLR
jgi:hypothetical protein